MNVPGVVPALTQPTYVTFAALVPCEAEADAVAGEDG
jgi:hypothetical protein